MLSMDTTQGSEMPTDDERKKRLEELEAADPADAPEVAEAIADDLTSALGAEDEGRNSP